MSEQRSAEPHGRRISRRIGRRDAIGIGAAMAAVTFVGAPILVNTGCACQGDFEEILNLPSSTIEELRMEADEQGRVPDETCLSYCEHISGFSVACRVMSDDALLCAYMDAGC